jgi:hypothetical protein
MSFYPKVDINGVQFPVDAASQEDVIILSGPATGTPPSSWEDPTTDDAWHPSVSEFGYPVNEWKESNGYTGYGTSAYPTRGWKVDTLLPDGWYTRIMRRDRH